MITKEKPLGLCRAVFFHSGRAHGAPWYCSSAERERERLAAAAALLGPLWASWGRSEREILARIRSGPV